jgi:outer membrane murein-binding lipoprotein Lpp
MKFLLALALLSSFAIANDAKEAKHEDAKTEVVAAKEEHKEEKKEDKKAAYKAAKEACLKENKDLKRKELKECIVSKNK